MELFKKRCSSYGGVINRALHKQEKLLDADPAKLDVAYLKHQIETVQSSSASFLKVHEEFLDTHADEIKEEQEIEALDAHEDNIAETLSLINRLIDMKNIHMKVSYFDNQLANLEDKVSANPDLSYPAELQDLKDKLQAMETAVSISTIPLTTQ